MITFGENDPELTSLATVPQMQARLLSGIFTREALAIDTEQSIIGELGKIVVKWTPDAHLQAG